MSESEQQQLASDDEEDQSSSSSSSSSLVAAAERQTKRPRTTQLSVGDGDVAALRQELAELQQANAQLLERCQKSGELMAQLCSAVQQREVELMLLKQKGDDDLRQMQIQASNVIQLYEKCLSHHHQHATASDALPELRAASDALPELHAKLHTDARDYFAAQHPQILSCPACLHFAVAFQDASCQAGSS